MSNSIILPSAVFAPVSYFALIVKQSNSDYPAVIETNDFFLKQTVRNRYRIYSAQGPLLLTIPLVSKSSKTLLPNVVINYDMPWQKEHLRTLEAAYSSTPFFEHYIDELMPVFSTEFESLVALNNWTFNTICRILQLELKVNYTETYFEEKPKIDFRQHRTEQFIDLKQSYYQLNFDRKMPFIPHLSILDLLFNHGPESRIWLKSNF